MTRTFATDGGRALRGKKGGGRCSQGWRCLAPSMSHSLPVANNHLPSRGKSQNSERGLANVQRSLRPKIKTTAPRIPRWSPTLVLTERYHTYLRRSDGMRSFRDSMAVDNSYVRAPTYIFKCFAKRCNDAALGGRSCSVVV